MSISKPPNAQANHPPADKPEAARRTSLISEIPFILSLSKDAA